MSAAPGVLPASRPRHSLQGAGTRNIRHGARRHTRPRGTLMAVAVVATPLLLLLLLLLPLPLTGNAQAADRPQHAGTKATGKHIDWYATTCTDSTNTNSHLDGC